MLQLQLHLSAPAEGSNQQIPLKETERWKNGEHKQGLNMSLQSVSDGYQVSS